jgi:hypothetical protein
VWRYATSTAVQCVPVGYIYCSTVCADTLHVLQYSVWREATSTAVQCEPTRYYTAVQCVPVRYIYCSTVCSGSLHLLQWSVCRYPTLSGSGVKSNAGKILCYILCVYSKIKIVVLLHWTLYSPMVTVCTEILTFSNSTCYPQTVFMCFVWIWEQTAILYLYSNNWLVFVKEV